MKKVFSVLMVLVVILSLYGLPMMAAHSPNVSIQAYGIEVLDYTKQEYRMYLFETEYSAYVLVQEYY